MTLLNVKLARAIWLVDSRDLNPRGIDIFPMISAVRDRYRFQTYPKTVDEMNEHDSKGIVFGGGSFQVEENQPHAIVKATMFGDGIVVDSTTSTDLSEAFLDDLLTFLSIQFGLTYSGDMIYRKIFTSEIIVRTEKDLSGFFAPLDALRERLNLLSGGTFQPFGLAFHVDPSTSTSQPAPFRFEREVNKSFDQQRYYSSAPLRTSDHETLLQTLEELL